MSAGVRMIQKSYFLGLNVNKMYLQCYYTRCIVDVKLTFFYYSLHNNVYILFENNVNVSLGMKTRRN